MVWFIAGVRQELDGFLHVCWFSWESSASTRRRSTRRMSSRRTPKVETTQADGETFELRSNADFQLFIEGDCEHDLTEDAGRYQDAVDLV